MKDHNPHDPVNMMGEAYKLFVEKTMHDLHMREGKGSTKPSKFIHRVIKPNIALTQKSFWIENKKYILKNSALEYLRHAGDDTIITLRRLNQIPSLVDKPDENNAPNQWHGDNAINASIYLPKNNTRQYKKCKNKTFRRLQ